MRSFFRLPRNWSVLAVAALLAAGACSSNSTPTSPTSPLTLSLTQQPALLPPGGGSVVIAATASNAGSPVAGATVTFATTAGTLSASTATTDGAGVARVTLTSTVAASVTASASIYRFISSADTKVEVGVDTKVTTVTVSADPAAGRRGELVTVRVSATDTSTSGSQPVAGTLVVSFGDGATANLGNVTGSATTTHAYQTEGTFTITATFTRDSKPYVATTKLAVSGFAPGTDQIDPSLITWLSPATTNISGWKITSEITGYSIAPDGSTVCISRNDRETWPLVSIDDNPPNIQANILVVIKVDGKWYGSGYDWMGQGRECKYEPAEAWGRDQIRVSPLDASWPGPRSGEEIGILMSTPSSERIPVRSTNQRTNIVRVIWP